jgi:hypothetical protein
MDYCPQKNEEKDQGEQCPASYFTGFFQMGILDRLKVQKACCIFKPREPFNPLKAVRLQERPKGRNR